MPPCESTLGCIDHALSDAEEEHSSQHSSAAGSIIDLTGSDSEEEHAPEQEEHAAEEDELAGMEEEDLEEQMVLEESIESARREEEAVHRVVEDSFETLREDRLRAWLRAKKKGKKAGGAARVPADELAELWMTALARRRAAFEAEASGTSGQCADDAEASGSGEGVAVDDAEASDTGVVYVSSSDEEDV